jgi:hypothetical protein
MTPTALKRVCRRVNIERWPFRKLQSLQNLLDSSREKPVDDPVIQQVGTGTHTQFSSTTTQLHQILNLPAIAVCLVWTTRLLLLLGLGFLPVLVVHAYVESVACPAQPSTHSCLQKRIDAILAEQRNVMLNPNHEIDENLLHMRLLTYKWRHAARNRATGGKPSSHKRKVSQQDMPSTEAALRCFLVSYSPHRPLHSLLVHHHVLPQNLIHCTISMRCLSLRPVVTPWHHSKA